MQLERQGESEPEEVQCGSVQKGSGRHVGEPLGNLQHQNRNCENGEQTTRFVPVLNKSWDAALPNPRIFRQD